MVRRKKYEEGQRKCEPKYATIKLEYSEHGYSKFMVIAK
jgi:hypothetical protein